MIIKARQVQAWHSSAPACYDFFKTVPTLFLYIFTFERDRLKLKLGGKLLLAFSSIVLSYGASHVEDD